MRNKTGMFINIINKYFSIPMIVIVFLTTCSVSLKGTSAGNIINLVLATVIIVYLSFIITALCKKIIKDKFMIIWLILSLILFIFSVMLSYVKESDASNILFVLGVGILEIYFIGVIVKNCFYKSNNVGTTIIYSIVFIILGFLLIYLTTYNFEDQTLFNSLITVFAALIGGAITLAGVAWTINNTRVDRIEDEKKKAKPYFTFNMIYAEPKEIEGKKICLTEGSDSNYSCEVNAEIENSNRSIIVLSKIYHDKKWFNLEANKMLINGGKVLFNFRFDEPNDIVLEVKDILGNEYYYAIQVLSTKGIGGSKIGSHTIGSFQEISEEEKNRKMGKEANS